jgi:hypothetical protein
VELYREPPSLPPNCRFRRTSLARPSPWFGAEGVLRQCAPAPAYLDTWLHCTPASPRSYPRSSLDELVLGWPGPLPPFRSSVGPASSLVGALSASILALARLPLLMLGFRRWSRLTPVLRASCRVQWVGVSFGLLRHAVDVVTRERLPPRRSRLRFGRPACRVLESIPRIVQEVFPRSLSTSCSRRSCLPRSAPRFLWSAASREPEQQRIEERLGNRGSRLSLRLAGVRVPEWGEHGDVGLQVEPERGEPLPVDRRLVRCQRRGKRCSRVLRISCQLTQRLGKETSRTKRCTLCRPEQSLPHTLQDGVAAKRIDPVDRIVAAIVLPIAQLARVAPVPQRIRADEPPRRRVVVAQPVVVEPYYYPFSMRERRT